MSNQTATLEKKNPMQEIRIEKIILSVGGKDKELEKSKKLIEFISGKTPQKIASRKRIPDFGVSPGVFVGARVTLRGEDASKLLGKLLGALNNTLSTDQVSDNHFSFGIKEYIEIPGVEYHREIGIRGFNVTVVFIRPGFRVKRKKIKSGKLPERQMISVDEIKKYMEEKFGAEFN